MFILRVCARARPGPPPADVVCVLWHLQMYSKGVYPFEEWSPAQRERRGFATPMIRYRSAPRLSSIASHPIITQAGIGLLNIAVTMRTRHAPVRPARATKQTKSREGLPSINTFGPCTLATVCMGELWFDVSILNQQISRRSTIVGRAHLLYYCMAG